MENLSPMMRQYLDIKEKHKDCIIFFRLGDFYEMFFEDAVLASKELEIALTGRDCGLEERAPMCGVPHHSADTYLSKLINKGYKVAIVEQTQLPGPGIKLVNRDVVRIVTPGTQTDDKGLNAKDNNYICSLYIEQNKFGYAAADVSTGDFFVGENEMDDRMMSLWDELMRMNPNEIIINESAESFRASIKNVFKTKNILVSVYSDWAYEFEYSKDTILKHFKVNALDALSCDGLNFAVSASGGLLSYLKETQKISLAQINRLSVSQNNAYMFLDNATRRNLELTETIRQGNERGSLLWVLDKTKTAMGARMLKSWIKQPLQTIEAIDFRLNGIQDIIDNQTLRESIRANLTHVYDLERLASRIAYGTIDPKNCISLRNSIENIPALKSALEKSDCKTIKNINHLMDDLSDLYVLLNSAVKDTPSNGIKDGNIIKDGFDEEIDGYRDLMQNGEKMIREIEVKEREITDIKTLKIGFNKVFGYYIEVTKSNLELVPYRYKRKQTLAGCERYITDELKRTENKILSAKEQCEKREYDLFVALREEIMAYIQRIQATARQVAMIDCLQSLAVVALENNYSRATFNTFGRVAIKQGRHPVVEKIIKDAFVDNDTLLDIDDNRTLMITGPNMAGKSTYLRQVALIVLMAHIGSYVPCKALDTAIVDRIFTRVGAMDDLSSGQSTFMVEMNEVSNILRNATRNSLLILDEIGRGTSTLDGLSIAWAVTEYVNDQSVLGAKTLFATHYHELTEIENRLDGIKNYRVTVKEFKDSVIFLHKISPGGTDRSFGIEVAKLAGLPNQVVNRSKMILKQLSDTHLLGQDLEKIHDAVIPVQPDDMSQDIVNEIKMIDMNDITPKQAFDLLYKFKDQLD